MRVGTLLIGNPNNGYGLTNQYALCVVIGRNGSKISVCIIASESGEGVSTTHSVYEDRFSEITIEQYFERFPDAEICSSETIDALRRRYSSDIRADLYECLCERKSVLTPIEYPEGWENEITDEERAALVEEMTELLTKYNHRVTSEAIDEIITEWLRNKCELIRMLKKHPNYNGRFQIVFDHDYERKTDANEIYRFCQGMMRTQALKDNLSVRRDLHPFTYKESIEYYRRLNDFCNLMESYTINEINGMGYDEVRAKRDKWKDWVLRYQKGTVGNGDYRYEESGYQRYENFRNLLDYFSEWTNPTLSPNQANKINYYVPEMKAKSGQKTSRALNKLCKLAGLDKLEDYNKKFAIYSDAINPLTIKRHTVLSVHPVDYLTMSFGNSWASCHTIDYDNIRETPKGYRGEYSSGTLSYMMDGASMIMYTVDAKYDGNEYELQDKINRNMFHYGFGKLIQGRVYPQDNDGDSGTSIYTTFREIAQKIVSECIENGVNAWLVAKGTSECSSVTKTIGTHYVDYTHYGNCNVSYYNKEKNTRRLLIGHTPKCPKCGAEHKNYATLMCDECRYDD